MKYEILKITTEKKEIDMASTAYNERFGIMAGVPRWIALQNSKLSGSWQVQVARHYAKPPPRCRQCGDRAVRKTKNK